MKTERKGIPLWIKLAFTVWIAVWVPFYWVYAGPANFLWLCDMANFIVLIGLWRQSSLLISSQAVGVLIIQAAWILDFLGRILLGFHPVGGTEYMFDPSEHLAVRILSLFHVFMPVLLLWSLHRLGFDRRAWRLQTLLTWIVLPASYLPDPTRNLNWIWAPFGVEQVWLPPPLYLGLCMVLYPLLLYLPTQALLLAWIRRAGRPIWPARRADRGSEHP